MASQSNDSVTDSQEPVTEDASQEDDAEPDDLVEEAKEIFKLCAERERDNRDRYIEDVKFGRLGEEHQWPEAIRRQRDEDGLPCLTINQMPTFVHQVINDTRQNKPTINVNPVDSGADRWTAQIISGGIRHIWQISNGDAVTDTAVDCSASGGFGYMRVVIEYTHDDSFDQDIKLKAVPDPLAVYGDPRSLEVDSSDWKNAFVTELIPLKEFKKEYPGAAATSFDAARLMQMGELWYQDSSVLIAEWWNREEVMREILKLSNGWIVGEDVYKEQKDMFDAAMVTVKANRQARSHKVTQRIMNGAEIIETNPWPGRFIPIIPVYGETVVIEGKRHLRSLIRDGKDPQRNFNYWRSKSSEVAATSSDNPFIGPESAFAGEYADRWDRANSEKFPFLAYPDGSTPPQREGYKGVDPAAMQEAANAANDIRSTIGMHQAALGMPSGNAKSGVAIDAEKVEGDVGTFHFTDNLSRSIRHTGNVLVDLMPHVYTPGRYLRVLGPDGVENFAQLGERPPGQSAPGPLPPTPGQAAIGAPQPIPASSPAVPGAPGAPAPVSSLPPGVAAAPTLPPAPPQGPQPNLPTATPPAQPLSSKPDFSQIYDIGVGKYDVVVTAGPGYTTKRQEAQAQMLELVSHFPQLAAIIGDLIAKNADWPEADEIQRRLQALLPPQIQALINGGQGQPQIPPQLMQQIQQGKQLIQNLSQALQKCQQELSAAKSDNSVDLMKAQTDQLKTQVDAFYAQTDRMQAQTDRGKMIIDAIQDQAQQPLGHGQQPGGQPGLPAHRYDHRMDPLYGVHLDDSNPMGVVR